MATVRTLMNIKKDDTNYTVDCNDKVIKALEVMASANIGAVLVAEGGKITGIFTERDYTRKGELMGRSAKTTAVKELMTEQMITVTTDTSLDQCMALMKQYNIRHLPVVENDKLVGLVSMRDVVAVLIADRESTIKGLENYILGSGFAT
ncbi:MAG: CBS domain-containing protein [Anaerolineales bacterium]